MSFIEPIYLVGLLAAALPLLIHLINRRRAVRVPFPAIRFLKQSQKRVATGIKIRQWVLMAIRMLIVAVLAMALAKPFMQSSVGVTESERLPTATVFVVDTSMSMESGDWWENAEDFLGEEISRLRPWDEVALVVAGAQTDPMIDALSTDHSGLKSTIRSLNPGLHSTDVRAAIAAASDILAPSQLPNRRIVVVTDLTQGGLEDGLPASVADSLVVHTVREDSSATNVSIQEARYQQEGSSRKPEWRIDAKLKNWGSEELQSQKIHLEVDGDVVAASLFTLSANGEATHTFRHRFSDARDHVVRVVLDIDDALKSDNQFVIPIRGDDHINTLLVNGEPSTVAYRDEMFFFERALNPKKDSQQSKVVPVTTTREGLDGRSLDEFDVVVLANVSHISAATAAKLEKFVQQGGGLLVTMGSQIDTKAYNLHMSKLMPKALRGLKRLATPEDPDAPVKITAFGAMNQQHPVFQVFELPGGDSLQHGKVFSYMLLEPNADTPAETLLSLKDAAPALVERTLGRGRVLLFTTSIDMEWTDLPSRPAYLPLMRRMINHLARRASSDGRTSWKVGEEITLDVGTLVNERLVIRGPDDSRFVLEPMDDVVTFRAKQAGSYTVWADTESDAGRLGMLDFAVNPNTLESNLTPVKADQLAKVTNPDHESRTSEKRRNLWPMFLFIVTLLLLSESVFGTRKSVLLKLWRRLTGKPAPSLDH